MKVAPGTPTDSALISSHLLLRLSTFVLIFSLLYLFSFLTEIQTYTELHVAHFRAWQDVKIRRESWLFMTMYNYMKRRTNLLACESLLGSATRWL